MSLPERNAALRISAPTALALAAALGVVGPACAAVPAAGYPASAQERDVLPWLSAHTSAHPGDVVALTPQAVVALDAVTHEPDQANLVDAAVREELIDAPLADHLHARSARIEVQVNCATGFYRIQQSTRFVLPDLKGDAVSTPMEGAGWTEPDPGTPMLKVARAACAKAMAAQSGAAGSAEPGAPAPAPPAAAPAQASAATSSAPSAPTPPPEVPPPAPVKDTATSAPPKPAAQHVSPAASASASTPAGPMFEVHLGSYSTEANAHTAIAQLTRGFASPMQGHEAVVRKIPVGGRDLFLVTVQGFQEHADAASFCKAVHAAPADCLIRR
jgi:hypothetical protein